MTPGIQSPFFLLLLLPVLPGEGPEVWRGSNSHSTVPPFTSSNHSSPSQVYVRVSFFSLSFYISNLKFNSSLENPETNYYQELQRNISELAVCRCRQKNYGHLDIFPSRETYHPMSEYPTYHTHGRYMPPGSTNRSPYEEVSAGNGGGSLSYTNPAVAATSANL
uniref:SEA domain-containing protein n=1 Tax=Urocitellus parryii TaxID=9999 RepID=A0A8D2KCL1_UROPR